MPRHNWTPSCGRSRPWALTVVGPLFGDRRGGPCRVKGRPESASAPCHGAHRQRDRWNGLLKLVFQRPKILHLPGAKDAAGLQLPEMARQRTHLGCLIRPGPYRLGHLGSACRHTGFYRRHPPGGSHRDEAGSISGRTSTSVCQLLGSPLGWPGSESSAGFYAGTWLGHSAVSTSVASSIGRSGFTDRRGIPSAAGGPVPGARSHVSARRPDRHR